MRSRPQSSGTRRAAYQPEVVATPAPVPDDGAALDPGYSEGMRGSDGKASLPGAGSWSEGPFPPAGPDGPCNPCGDACGFAAFSGCDPFFQMTEGRWRFRGEYLLWWTKAANLPPLVTTSPAGTAQDEAGILGLDSTDVLLGGGIDMGARSGARFTLSFSSDPCRVSALEASYLFISDKALTFSQSSEAGDPILAIPFFNVDPDSDKAFQQDALLIAFPGVAIDSQLTAVMSNEFQSFELLGRDMVFEECGRRLDVLYGYRYSRFAERNSITYAFTSGPDNLLVPEGTVVNGSDVFAAANEFHGAELGLSGQAQYYRWSLEGVAKLALGGTRSRTTTYGRTTIRVPGQGSVTTLGGLLAQPTNMGAFSQENFTAIPEVGLTAGLQITPRMKATVGYSLIYWSRVARPGDQIDAGYVPGSPVLINVNPSQFGGGNLVGMPAPQHRFITTDFWTQGLSFGLDCRF